MNRLRYGDVLLYYDKSIWFRKLTTFFFRSFYAHAEFYIGNGESINVTFTKKGFKIKKINMKDKFHIYRFNVDQDKLEDSIVNNLAKAKGFSIWLLFLLPIMWLAKMLRLKWFENPRYITCIEFVIHCLQGAKCKTKKDFRIVASTACPDDVIIVFENKYIPKEKIYENSN